MCSADAFQPFTMNGIFMRVYQRRQQSDADAAVQVFTRPAQTALL